MLIALINNNTLYNLMILEMTNIKVFSDILDCQICLSQDNMECDMLILDWNMFTDKLDVFIDWIIKKKLFIKHILIFCDDDQLDIMTSKCYNIVSNKLKRAQYKFDFISVSQLIKGLKKIHDDI